MMPNRRDLTELVGTLKWFVGLGERPAYGRWTYWEKFDYFAVFWGIAVIGSTGLTLWFPVFFTRFLPGSFLNVATIIHSDEALLATGFIFTVHFFNTHLRPEKFPMDITVFTGRMPLEELERDKPREYEALVASGQAGGTHGGGLSANRHPDDSSLRLGSVGGGFLHCAVDHLRDVVRVPLEPMFAVDWFALNLSCLAFAA